MSYHQYWRLSRLPFGHIDRREDFFQGGSQREAIARLQFLAGNARAIGLLIGQPGTGKTTLMNHVHRNMIWTDAVVEPLMLSGRTDDATTWLSQLASSLGAPLNQSKVDAWRFVCDALDALSRQDVQTCMLIDDASETVAEVVGSFINRSRHTTAVLTCGPDKSGGIVQRVGGCPLRIDLLSWSLEDSAGFIHQALINADGHPGIFTDAAIVRMHELSEGCVATIARLAELSLLAGAGSRASHVTPELVEAIQEETLVAGASSLGTRAIA